MSAEGNVLEWLQDSLLMNVKGVGPNVFSYDIERITPDLMPCITITLDSSEITEASTLKQNHKRVIYSVGIHVINRTAFWSIKELCNIRERISQVLESFQLPASVVDFKEESTSAFETRTEIEYPVIMQSVNYSFLVKEADY